MVRAFEDGFCAACFYVTDSTKTQKENAAEVKKGSLMHKKVSQPWQFFISASIQTFVRAKS